MSMMTITLTVTSTLVTTATAGVTFLPTHSHSVHQFPHHIIRQGWQVGGTLTVLRHHLDQEEHDAGGEEEGQGRGRGGATFRHHRHNGGRCWLTPQPQTTVP